MHTNASRKYTHARVHTNTSPSIYTLCSEYPHPPPCIFYIRGGDKRGGLKKKKKLGRSSPRDALFAFSSSAPANPKTRVLENRTAIIFPSSILREREREGERARDRDQNRSTCDEESACGRLRGKFSASQ